MNSKLIGAFVAIVAVVGIGAFVYSSNQSTESSSMSEMSMQAENNNPFTNRNMDQSTDEIQEGTVKMDIAGFAFAQKAVKVKPGTTITWTNQDDAKHDITPTEDSPNFLPSELLAKGESYSYTFEEPGIYSYICSPHPYMKASVEVVAL